MQAKASDASGGLRYVLCGDGVDVAREGAAHTVWILVAELARNGRRVVVARQAMTVMLFQVIDDGIYLVLQSGDMW